jgi:urease accessory protein
MRRATRTVMAEAEATRHDVAHPEDDSARLLKLMTLLSPAFPVGSFAYSHGLETLIVDGTLGNAEEMRLWLTDLLEMGSIWNDAALFCQAHAAAMECDSARLSALAELALALTGSKERHLETMAQGRAFIDAASAGWPSPSIAHFQQADVPYPVAVGAVAADHRIEAEAAAAAYLNALCTSLVSVCVRLIPLGQSAGVRLLASLHPRIAATAKRAAASTLDDLGSATILSDIAAMRHETLHSRVFRT